MYGDPQEKDENVLEKFGRDIVEDAKAGKIDPVIGRDEEIRSITRILSRKTKNNQNIKKLYLNNFNSNEIITINKEKLNFDIFERNKQFIPLYEGKLYHPVLQYF